MATSQNATQGSPEWAHFVRTKWPLLILAVIAILYPFIDSLLQTATNYRIGGYTGQFVNVMVYSLLALGLNIVVGYAGLLDLGYAAFFAIGAYSMALVTSPSPPWGPHPVPFPFSYFWVGIVLAAALAAFSGLLLGSPTIPLRGDYLAIVTLGFGEVVPVVFRNLTCVTIPILGWDCLDITGGEKGVNPIALPTIPATGYTFNKIDLGPWYWLAILLMVFLVFINMRLQNSRLGRSWMAMREDEDAAAAMGIDTVRTKLLAFSMGAMISGFAGAYYSSYIQGVFPSTFEFSTSIIILSAVILGGIGNPYGALLGGLAIVGVDTILLPTIDGLVTQSGITTSFGINNLRYGIFGATLILMMLFRPEGLLPNQARARELHESTDEEQASGVLAAEQELARESEAG
jgi:branched-chain amino acid transport system permease protein